MTTTQQKRKAWVRAGLTTRGERRTNRQHPELAGLAAKDYHTAYMKKQRENDRSGWGKDAQNNHS